MSRLTNAMQYLLGENKPILIDGEPFEADEPAIAGQRLPDSNSERRPSSADDKKAPENMV